MYIMGPDGLVRVGRAMVAKKIRGVMFEENANNSMGLEFYNLSHRFGYQSPNWPYFEDVKIERIHYHAKSGVLSQRITTSMHNTTHIDAPAHVVQGTPFIDEVPLPHFFGSGIVVSIPKKKWEPITYDDLEKAAGKIVRPRDVVIVNTGWHHQYEDSEDYFCRSPGFVPSAGHWFVEKKVKVVGHDTQANDQPLATAIGPQRNGPLHPHLAEEYREWSGGRDWKQDFPEWEPVHRILFKSGILGIENVGGDIDKVTGRRCTFAYFPWNWDRGDGPDASPTEKVYVIIAGELTVIVDGKETVLKANDSCFIGPNESREIINRGNDVVTMLVAVSTPQK